MKKVYFAIVLLLVSSRALFAQVSINTDNSTPDPSAMLDVNSTTKGALLPRMTQSQIAAILNPANGLQVFCTTNSKIYIYIAPAGQWKEIAFGAGTIMPPPYSCGTPLTIYHVTGSVAPVEKTVTYNTITNIPGEPSKCWITSNLGADHQATADNDATEASAGWYWQFNRKQGYKHDGTTRTPNIPWITNIYENSNWITVNDPCTIELGAGWHIPTYTEWYNVYLAGGWMLNGSWNSELKVHYAGSLLSSNGSLDGRGVGGTQWTSTEDYPNYSVAMACVPGGCSLDPDYDKTYGFSLRCLR